MDGFDRSLAFVVAIDRYGSGVPELKTPVSDAKGLAEVLERGHGFEVEIWPNEKATLDGIRTLLAGMPARVGSDDRVVFYFAGHGIALESVDGPRGFILPQDAEGNSHDKYLPMTELHESLSALPCRHMLVVLDCCFAGAFRWSSFRHLALAPTNLHKERYEWFVQDKAWQAIASAAHDQEAIDVAARQPLGMREDGREHSPFASALIRGLKGAADRAAVGGCGDGVITATELYLYLEDELLPKENSEHRQTPIFWPLKKHDKGQFVFLVPGKVPELSSAPALDTDANPWRGLEPYEAKHAELFFGRGEVSKKLVERVLAERFIVVTGPSGIGKSSLVRAGLLARLHDEPGLKERPLEPIIVRPGAAPFAGLARALRAATAEGGSAPDETKLNSDPTALATWVKSRPGEGGILLVIDQTEELITMSQDDEIAKSYLTLVARALDNPLGRLRAVFTVRSEYEPQFAQWPLKDRWTEARFLVPLMTQDELRRVIEGPAAIKVMRFEPAELIDQLVNEVVQMPGALPLLSFALSQMYTSYLKRRSDNRALTYADYEALEGGVTGALRIRADQVVDGVDEAHQATARRVLERLVSVESGAFARRRVPRREFEAPDAIEQARVDLILKRLDKARLVITDEVDGEAYLELAHDALIFGWNRLLSWIRHDAPLIGELRQLTTDAEAWAGSQKQKAGLLWSDSARLAAVQKLQATSFPGLSKNETSFAVASGTRARRNSLITSAAVATLLLLCVGLGALSFLWRDQRDGAVSRQIAAQSNLAARDARLNTALLLSLAAFDKKDTQEARRAIFENLQRAGHLTKLITTEPDHRNSIAISKDTTLVAVGGKAGSLDFYSFETGRVVTAVGSAHKGAVSAIVYSDSCKCFISAGKDGLVKFWSGTVSTPIRSVAMPPEFANGWLKNMLDDNVLGIAASDDGRFLAFGGYFVQIYDLESGVWSAVARRPKPENRLPNVTNVQFAPKRPGVVGVAWSQGSVEVWDVKGGRLLFPAVHDHPSRYMVQTFDPTTGKSTSEERSDAAVDALALSPDGTLIATGGRDNRVVVRKVDGGALVGEALTVDSAVNAVSFQNDNSNLLVLSNAIQWWSLPDRRVAKMPLQGMPLAQMSASGNRLVALGQDLAFWDWNYWSIGEFRARQSVEGLPKPADNIQVTRPRISAFVEAGGDAILTSSRDARLTQWNIGRAGKSHVLDSTTSADLDVIDIVSLSTSIVILTRKKLEFWSVGENNTLTRASDVETPTLASHMLASKNGRKVVIAGVDGVYELEIATLKWNRLSSGAGRVLAASGGRFASLGAGVVKIVDLTGAVVWEWGYEKVAGLTRIELSPSGNLLAVDFSDKVDVWNVDEKKRVSRLETGGLTWVSGRSLSFSSDDRYVGVGTPDYGFSIWDVSNGLFQYELRNRDVCCSSIWRFDPRRERLAEISEKGITIWNLDILQWRKRVCELVPRILSPLEVARYLPGSPGDNACLQGSSD